MPTKYAEDAVYFYRQDSFLSNHHPAPFVVKERHFSCVEQFYMYSKAVIFNDQVMADAILNTNDPAKIMQLNALMKTHDYADWSVERRYKIMVAGTYAKYFQNPNLLRQLLETGDRVILESSPNKVWGIGVDINSQFLQNRKYWNGDNLLGKAIMDVRGLLGGEGIVN
ncbi:NADAR family protein [Vibrio coralliirubri]|uniref:NADAR family protein n=1 Tax=Vibrio coralliirubri TaxID=1516159 RepID=UPI002284E011|nr:NADAR family protein [Vibrio coralliirubri]MCY9861308.1 NADAR family protein [Vibrio coralliirubri]